jgi:hypothetical protein
MNLSHHCINIRSSLTRNEDNKMFQKLLGRDKPEMEEILFNPDPLINRLEMVTKLIRMRDYEELSLNSENQINRAIELIFYSLEPDDYKRISDEALH